MRMLALMLLLCLPMRLLAWDLPGHILVAQIAYENLAPATQVKVDVLADRVFDQLPLEDQNFLNRHAGAVSHYARLAALPDEWSGLSLQQLFLRFHASLPPALKPYASGTTSRWHFMQNPYAANGYCHAAAQAQNVVWAIPLLQKAFLQSQDPNTQAVILVLLSHFVADIHQPLHVITKSNWFCGHDRGGNGFCLKRTQGVCRLSLHKFWDSALGYANWHRNLSLAAEDLQKKWPAMYFALALQQPSPVFWAQQEFSDADFIYSTPQNHWPSKASRPTFS